MESKELFKKTINHEEPMRVVTDFGATAVTGIHVLSIEKLRDYYGLGRKPIRVTEPFQMLGEVDWELLDILDIDVVGAWGRNNMFGFTQDSTFCAPEQFDKMWLPYYKKVNEWIHTNTQWKTFKGYLRERPCFLGRWR